MQLKTYFIRATLAATLTVLLGCRGATDLVLEQTVDQTYRAEPTANLSVVNRDGSIRVYGAGGGAQEIRVEAIKKAYSTERLQAISVRVEARPNSVSIETVYPPEPAGALADRSGTVDTGIVVPQSARIWRLDLGNGEVLVEGMRSEQADVHLASGRLCVHTCFGP